MNEKSVICTRPRHSLIQYNTYASTDTYYSYIHAHYTYTIQTHKPTVARHIRHATYQYTKKYRYTYTMPTYRKLVFLSQPQDRQTA